MPSPSSIAKYEPLELLGSAGPVDTFRARAKETRTLVALKVFFLERAGGQAGRAAASRFLAAARHSLETPIAGVGRVLEVADHSEGAFVATELSPGLDLARLLALGARACARKPDRLVAMTALIGSEIARTLSVAHAAQLFHLGLGPGNVIVDATGGVSLLDFGLSAAWRDLAGPAPSTSRFLAPELVSAKPASLTRAGTVAADLFALGALLHLLLGGVSRSKRAERGGRELPPEVPKPLLDVVRALTAPDPHDRPDAAQTVVELLNGIVCADDPKASLASHLTSLGLGARAKLPSRGVATRARRRGLVSASEPAPATRGKSGWVLAALISVIVLAAGAFAGWRITQPAGARKQPPPKSLPSKPSLHISAVEIPRSVPDGGLASDPTLPTDRVYLPGPKHKLPRVPDHLYLATNPAEADVWVDGILKGKTPVDLVIGPGGHRVVAIKTGYRMLRAVYDTTEGEYVRKDLQRVAVPNVGDGLLDVECGERNRYPLFLDDEETGLLCPASKLPVPSGHHSVGIFVPVKRTVITVEVDVPRGPKPLRVKLGD